MTRRSQNVCMCTCCSVSPAVGEVQGPPVAHAVHIPRAITASLPMVTVQGSSWRTEKIVMLG